MADLMSYKWAELIENRKLSELLPMNIKFQKLLLSRKKEHIDTSEIPADNIKSLSTVEQLLLVKYFAIGSYEFQDILCFLNKYGIQKVLRYASHFHKARFVLYKNERSFIVLQDAKKSSVQLFSESLKQGKISTFILSLYLNDGFRDRKFPNLATHPRAIYKLKTDYIDLLSEIELTVEAELVSFLRICHPDFRTEPNMLYLNENLVENFGIRLLATVYKEIYLIVETKTNLVVFIGAKN